MKLNRIRFEESIQKLNKIKILVVGDAILDEYLLGEVNRISPEAPVPVVLVQNEKLSLGGAGNVIKNLSSIGVKSEFYAKAGKDVQAKYLEDLLKQ
jgi:bifunctional ADP-heptose synthase (sugar kinase/adenylyltransferase)